MSTVLAVAGTAAIGGGFTVLIITVLRVLSNGGRTATAFGDSAIQRHTTFATTSFVIGLVGLFTFPVIGVLAGFVWPLSITALERELVAMERGTDRRYRRSLILTLLLLGLSAVLGAGSYIYLFVTLGEWDRSTEWPALLIFLVVLLTMMIGNGLVMIVAGARLFSLWNAPSATRLPPPNVTSVPAGWYPDPSSSALRYWDGAQWTDHLQPGPLGV